jgi:hypothetical protein
MEIRLSQFKIRGASLYCFFLEEAFENRLCMIYNAILHFTIYPEWLFRCFSRVLMGIENSMGMRV